LRSIWGLGKESVWLGRGVSGERAGLICIDGLVGFGLAWLTGGNWNVGGEEGKKKKM
jgi:hypothetical protein